MRKTSALPLLALAMLTGGCSKPAAVTAPDSTASTTPASTMPTYADNDRAFAIAVPKDMQLRHDFQRSYLGDDGWKSAAGSDKHGEPAIALVLAGSDRITAAELRIGVGSDDDAKAHCLEPSANASPSETVTLAGTPFTHFHAADAAMSHYLDMDSYRAVHDGRCYAIDLLVTGTRPEVYDPPAVPPFTQDAAKKRLHEALSGFRWLP
jgi:hypothetical protein